MFPGGAKILRSAIVHNCYNFNFSVISFDNAALGITMLSVLIAK